MPYDQSRSANPPVHLSRSIDGGTEQCGTVHPHLPAALLAQNARGLGIGRTAIRLRSRSLTAALSLALGCSSSLSETTQTPAPALADSGSAQRAFRSLSERWHAAAPEHQVQLITDFQRFLADYPTDDQGRLARAYLAWILVYAGDLYEARQLIEATRRGPPGAANDFAAIAEAALLVEYGQPHEALKLLRPLQGKVIDPVERFFASQQLVASAMAANLYAEALTHMVDWIVQANVVRRDAVREAARGHLERVPRRYLERALTTLAPSSDAASDPVRLSEQQWLYDAIVARLGAIAVRQRDRALAKRVLDANPSLDSVSADLAALVHLATGVSERAAVTGRTAGVLLNLGSDASRRRSNQGATGFSLSLEFPDQDPSAADVDIVFGDDSVQLEQGLAELAAAGASLLLTGFTARDATIAARFAARERIPVLLFHPPELESSYAFVLGHDTHQLPAPKQPTSSIVVSETMCALSQNTPTHEVFPIPQWVAEEKQALYLMGDGACTKRLLAELRSSGFEPELWFGLEAAHLWPGTGGRFHTITSGRFPLTKGTSKAADDLSRRLGHSPTWYETLGRDASVVVREVFDALPNVTLQDDDEVAHYHTQIVERLMTFHSDELWSSNSGSFDGRRQLKRDFTWQ